MADLSIGEVSRQTGVPTSTLRYYEALGLLHPPRRESGRRRYDESVLQRLALIRSGQQAGFTLSEVGLLLNQVLDAGSDGAAPHEWQSLVSRKLTEIDAMLRSIARMKELLEDIMNCDDDTLAECIVQTAQRYPLPQP